MVCQVERLRKNMDAVRSLLPALEIYAVSSDVGSEEPYPLPCYDEIFV